MPLSPGLVKTPFVDDGGVITNPWAKYLEEIESGPVAGTSGAADLSAILARLAALESDAANLRIRVAKLELGVQM